MRLISLVLTVVALLGRGRPERMTALPPSPEHPVLFIWNKPTDLCQKYNIVPDLSLFHYVGFVHSKAINQDITLFYATRFGTYPHLDNHYGIIPQRVDYVAHEKKATDDVNTFIPRNKPGFSVVDFEEWRPLWARNWGAKKAYRMISREEVIKRFSHLSADEVDQLAKKEFTEAAKKFMLHCLDFGRKLRPKQLWGYYLFPDCYNNNFKDPSKFGTYTGKCPELELKRNEMLDWLWNATDVLYPSIYLEKELRGKIQGRWFTRYRIHESTRVGTRPNASYVIPTYVYIRPTLKFEMRIYLTKFDLVNTIGEAVAQGVAGIISWGGMEFVDNKKACVRLADYMDQIMNPYILNVSTAAEQCSAAVCQSRGRCTRKDWKAEVFLHLDPTRYKIVKNMGNGKWFVSPTPHLTDEDIERYNQDFECMRFVNAPVKAESSWNSQTCQSPLLLLAALFGLTFVWM